MVAGRLSRTAAHLVRCGGRQGLGLGVGDTLTVNVLGREVTARIANLRRIRWTSLAINFTILFAPGTLEGAPRPISRPPG